MAACGTWNLSIDGFGFVDFVHFEMSHIYISQILGLSNGVSDLGAVLCRLFHGIPITTPPF